MDTAKTSGYISCGDTKFCKECQNFIHLDVRADREAIRLTLNDLGRCDYYSGVNKVIYAIALQT
ncbi:MAG: hypothetical protein JKY17_03660 [Magnetovibrio sp.]|nr:hypothetical protein [Magnetovibrio sp.]